MKDYKEYYNTIAKSAETTGQKPSIKDYILIKILDNWPIVSLFILTLVFAGLGLFLVRA